MRVGVTPENFPLSCRSALATLGTSTARPGSAPRPNAARGTSFAGRKPTAPLLSDEYGACTDSPPRPGARWDYHSPCPDTSAAGPFSSAAADPPQWLRWFLSART